MIPYDTDPTLHDHEPARRQLDDGFSPPRAEPAAAEPITRRGEATEAAPGMRDHGAPAARDA